MLSLSLLKKHFKWAALLVIGFTVGVVGYSLSTHYTQDDHQWNTKEFPAFVAFDSTLSDKEDLIVRDINRWNDLCGEPLLSLGPTLTSSTYVYGSVTYDVAILLINEIENRDPDVVAVTSRAIKANSTEIDYAYIDMLRTTPDTHIEATILHELGHALGLVHTTDPKSVMYIETNPTKLNFTEQDKQQLLDKYGQYCH